MDNLFSTHPRVENRVRALEAMAGEVRPPVAHPGRARSRPSAAAVDGAGPRRPPGGRGAARGGSRRGLASPTRRRCDGPRPLAPAERARAQALAAATLRHLGRIDALLGGFLRRPPPAPALNALRLATAEMHLDGGAGARGGGRRGAAGAGGQGRGALAGLVNAVARRVADGGPALWDAAPEAGLPDWLAAPSRRPGGEAAPAAIAAAQRRGRPST